MFRFTQQALFDTGFLWGRGISLVEPAHWAGVTLPQFELKKTWNLKTKYGLTRVMDLKQKHK